MLRFLIYKLKNSCFSSFGSETESKKFHLVNENEPYNILSCVPELVLALKMLQNFKIEEYLGISKVSIPLAYLHNTILLSKVE